MPLFGLLGRPQDLGRRPQEHRVRHRSNGRASLHGERTDFRTLISRISFLGSRLLENRRCSPCGCGSCVPGWMPHQISRRSERFVCYWLVADGHARQRQSRRPPPKNRQPSPPFGSRSPSRLPSSPVACTGSHTDVPRFRSIPAIPCSLPILRITDSTAPWPRPSPSASRLDRYFAQLGAAAALAGRSLHLSRGLF